MKDPGKRLGQTIAAAIIFLIVYAAVMLNFEQRHNTDLIMADSVNKTESLRGMIEGYGKTADEIGKGFCEKENARVRLEAIGLAPLVVNGEFTGDRFGENGMVVRVHKGKLDLPPEAEGLFPGLTVEMVTSEYVQNRTEASGEAATPVLLTSGPISGEWYYVRWTPAPEYDAYIRSCLPVERLTDMVQSIHDIEMFIIPSEGSPEEDRDRILYKTKGFGKYSALSELGLSEDDLDRESFTLLTDGKEYVCFPVEAENTGYTFICCNSVENEKMAILGDIIWQVLFAAIMLSGLITWCYSVRWFVRMESLDEKQRRRYSPEVVRRRTNRLTFVGTLVVTLFSFTTVIVQFMYHENRIGSNVLALLETRIEDVGEIDSSTGTLATERFADLGQTVSAMLTRDPALLKKDSLAGISDAISAKYLILYDEKGQEIACSRDYTGFSLPTDKSDAFSDFRRLLKGVPVIAHGAEEDMITGDMTSFVGVRYDVPGRKNTYGALLIALPSPGSSDSMPREVSIRVEDQVKDQIYQEMQSEEEVILEVDPQTKKIVSCSREAYTGEDIGGLGIDSRGLKDRYMNFYYLENEWYFGIAGAVGDHIYFYMKDSTSMSRLGFLLALVSGVLFMIGHVITARFALKGYTEENYEHLMEQVKKASEAYTRRIAEKAPSIDPVAGVWRDMLPEDKVKAVMQIQTGILFVFMILVSFSNHPLGRHSILNFVIRGNWARGINLFSLIAVLVTFCVEYLAYLVLKVTAFILDSVTDLKGETVFKLLHSFINYAMFIGAVCVSLKFLGVDTTTLLA